MLPHVLPHLSYMGLYNAGGRQLEHWDARAQAVCGCIERRELPALANGNNKVIRGCIISMEAGPRCYENTESRDALSPPAHLISLWRDALLRFAATQSCPCFLLQSWENFILPSSTASWASGWGGVGRGFHPKEKGRARVPCTAVVLAHAFL